MRLRMCSSLRKFKWLSTVTAVTIAMSGCSFAPSLNVPAVAPATEQFKETAPWTKAEPADTLPREAWWTLYRDTELDALQQQLLAHSPDLTAALARYQQAVAYNTQIRAALFPTVDAVVDAQRNRQSAQKPLRGATSPDLYDDFSLAAQVNYEVDLWGRIRNQVTSATASEQAAQADLESARLSLQALLADDYIQLRGLDRENALLEETVTAYAKALSMIRAQHDGGMVSGLDLARAQTQYDSARSQVSQNQAARALIEHAIAALIGEPASTFSLPPRREAIHLPNIPAGLPSALLQRRPDIAAAQRRVEAANADIGVARAAYFPAITLGGIFGYESTEAGNIITAPNRFWAIGPSLVLNLFDAGRRRAEVSRSEAVLEEVTANYRGAALAAFQQVEDSLAQLKHYRSALAAERSAADAAQQSLTLSLSRYRAGGSSYLEVVTSQTAALQTERSVLDIDTRQLRASVQLIRSLGGGWSAPVNAVAACPAGETCKKEADVMAQAAQ